MSILSVDQISPIGSGTTITLNATEVKTGTEITVGTGASIFSPAGNTLTLGTNNVERIRIKNDGKIGIGTNNPQAMLEVQDRSGGTLIGLSVGTQYGNAGFGGYNNYPAIMNNTAQPLIYCDTNNDRTIFFGDTVGFGTTCAFRVNGAERLRIGNAGQLGIAGANYGTSGQVLTSQGSGSAVQWATPAVTGGNMFIAKMSGGYNTSNNTDGEIVFQNEVFDSDNRYSNSNGRFTPNVAGYYFIDASLQFSTNSANNLFESTIWKNGSEQFKNRMWNDGANSELHCKVTGIVAVNGSSDYISIAAWQNSGGNITVNPGNGSYFMGYFLRPL